MMNTKAVVSIISPSLKAVALSSLVLFMISCGGGSSNNGSRSTTTGISTAVDPARLSPIGFVLDVTNQLFPLVPGTSYIYGGKEDILVEVTMRRIDIQGISAIIVRDRVFEDGALVEDTDDYFAQDAEGNVWYLGEDVQDFDPDTGQVVAAGSDAGSFLAGVDGALPGIQMPANPKVGDVYIQELAPGIAEDMAENVDTNASVSTPAGDFSGCLLRREFTPLEPGVSELKWFCPGVGLVKEMVENHTDPEEVGEVVELIGISSEPQDPSILFSQSEDEGEDEEE